MSYNISRDKITKKKTTIIGERITIEEHTIEDVVVYGTNDILAFLAKLLEERNVSFHRLKTCMKFKTITEAFEDIEKQVQQKFPQRR